jgi:hypothetical protein
MARPFLRSLKKFTGPPRIVIHCPAVYVGPHRRRKYTGMHIRVNIKAEPFKKNGSYRRGRQEGKSHHEHRRKKKDDNEGQDRYAVLFGWGPILVNHGSRAHGEHLNFCSDRRSLELAETRGRGNWLRLATGGGPASAKHGRHRGTDQAYGRSRNRDAGLEPHVAWLSGSHGSQGG